jgi:hypothetical protein
MIQKHEIGFIAYHFNLTQKPLINASSGKFLVKRNSKATLPHF